MSKLEELLNELCPKGVPKTSIADICNISRGRVMSKDYIKENLGQYPVYSSQTENDGRLGLINSFDYDGEYLTWTTDGANAGTVFYRTGKFSITNVCGLLKVTNEQVLTKYLYYTLSVEAPSYVSSGMGNPKLMSNVMGRIKVAIPPLPVQSEIVRILDNFTELTARKKQYEYYRDELLTFGDEVETKSLRHLVTFKNGKGHEKVIVNNGKYIVVNSKFISTNGEVKKYSDRQICPLYMNDVLMVMSDLPNGRALAKCFLVDANDKYTLNQRIGCFHTNDEHIICTKFLLYILNRNRQLLRYDNGADQTNLRKNDILDMRIPVPSLDTQKKIVEILNRFDTLCNDISTGLPAEIEARKKQYEYYRDKLLTFKELS